MDELKLCPFCGGMCRVTSGWYDRPYDEDITFNIADYYEAWCFNCQVKLKRDTIEEVTIAWNTRTPDKV